MNAKDIKVDFSILEKDAEDNAKERLKFVAFWANYVKTHSDDVWSEQQNVVINSQLG